MMKYLLLLGFCIALVLSSNIVSATASFEVSNFACTPPESSTNSPFSCTATVSNVGDTSGNVGTVTLFPDSDDWLEDSNYPKAVSQSVGAGESVDVAFTGLRGVKSGENGFSRITIDDVSDSSSTVTSVEVNLIDVSVSVDNSASSVMMGNEFTSSAEVTAGGSIDVALTFTIDSGGCSLGNQNAEKIMNGMTDGSKQSKTWTVTMGTGGSCKFTISAAATGEGGVATKTSSVKSTVTCPDCPVSSSSSGGSSASAAAGAGGSENGTELKDFAVSVLSVNDIFNFLFNKERHTLKILNLTSTTATISVKSTEKIFTLSVGEQMEVDFEEDGRNEIIVLLKTINIITKKATLVITPLYLPNSPPADAEKDETSQQENEERNIPILNNFKKPEWILGALIIICIVACGIIAIVRARWEEHKAGNFVSSSKKKTKR